MILVYDISNKQSFENLKNIWYKDLKTFGEKCTVLAIVGNKIRSVKEYNGNTAINTVAQLNNSSADVDTEKMDITEIENTRNKIIYQNIFDDGFVA